MTGCITVTPGGRTAWNGKPKVQNVSFEEQIEETPGDPKNPTQLKLTYAKLMEEAGHMVEARKHFSSVKDKEPTNVDAMLGLARIEMATGDAAKAEQGFKQALSLDSNSLDANYGIGQFYGSQNRWSEAIDPLTKAMLGAPDNAEYRFHLAVALTHTGDVDSALPHFIRTVGDAEAHYNVALILKDQNNLDLAERHFLLALTKNPEMKTARVWLNKMRLDRQKLAQGDSPTQIRPVGHRVATADAAMSPRQREQRSNQSAIAVR